MVNNYFEAVALDTKPEKGERKVADDFLVLLNEHTEQVSMLKNSNQSLTTEDV